MGVRPMSSSRSGQPETPRTLAAGLGFAAVMSGSSLNGRDAVRKSRWAASAAWILVPAGRGAL